MLTQWIFLIKQESDYCIVASSVVINLYCYLNSSILYQFVLTETGNLSVVKQLFLCCFFVFIVSVCHLPKQPGHVKNSDMILNRITK